MAAIVSGGSIGLLGGSLDTLGTRGRTGNALHGASGEGVYVNAASGNLVLQRADEVLIGAGVNASVLRTYNSQGLLDDDNGDNWRLGAYKRVHALTGTINAAGSTVRRVEADGSESVYVYDGTSGKYLGNDGDGAQDSLAFAAGVWTWTDGPSQASETYDDANGGRIIQRLDADGNGLTFTYDAAGLITQVTDASGETTYLDYAGTNLTQLRTVKAGGAELTRVGYAYDASNRLTQVTVDLTPEDNSVADGQTYVTTYTYDGTSRRVASLSQSDGTILAFSYVLVGADYRVATITDALGRVTSLSYNTAARTTTVTDPLGHVTSFGYDASGQLTGVTGPAVGGVSQQIGFAYDASGNVTQTTDARGNTVVYQYDARNNWTLKRDSAGNTVTRTYGAGNELLTETIHVTPDPDGAGSGQPADPLTTRFAYDGELHLRYSVDAEGRVTEHRYNASGQRVATLHYAGSTHGLAGLTSSDALSESTLDTWAAGADKTQATRVEYSYDFRGQLSRSTTYGELDANGDGVASMRSDTDYVYDQAGNLLASVDPRGVATTSDPDDYRTAVVYDGLGRVLSTTDSLGHVTLTQYDAANRRTIVTLANGLVRTSTYTAAGDLVSVLDSSGAQTLSETKYFYDADGRLRRAEDATGVRRHALYDAAGRVVGEIDGDGSLTELRYDANNNLTRTIRYATAVSAANLASLMDAQGNPTGVALASIRPAASGADRSTWNAYDASNRLTKSVDEAGFVTQRFYDGAGRLTDVIRFATAVATASLGDAPAASSIAPASSSADRLTRSFYDGAGALLATLDGEGYLVEYRYDGAGRPVETVGYATVTAAALRATGTLAQLLPASGAADTHGHVLYNARGQVAGTLDAEGYLTESVYDEAGNKTQSIRYATRVAYSAGATVASLRPESSAQDQVSGAAYDALSRLASATDAQGSITQYTYDEVGNLTKTVTAAGTTEVRALKAQYDRQGRLTAQLTGNGVALLTGGQTQAEVDAIWAANAIKYTYDAAGRRTSVTDANGRKTLLFYDADGRLTHTINALGEVAQSAYNALGQLTQQIQYGTRLSAATLAGLSGGLATPALASAVAAIQNASVDTRVSHSYYTTGNLQQTTDPLSNTVTQSFNAFGELVGTSQQIGGAQTLDHTYAHDKRGLLTLTVWDPAGLAASESAQYDAFGRAVQSTDANGNSRTRTYDKLGRVVATLDPLGRANATSYDAFGRVLVQTDALGKETRYAYDAANRSVTVTTPEGIVTTAAQNRHGQTLSITDGRGNSTTYTYDRDGNVTSVSTPGAGTSSSHYDAAGLLIDTTDANGVKTAYTYDNANRMLTRSVDPGAGHLNLVTSYAYDAKGQTVTVTDARGVATQTQFDLKGEAVSVTLDPGAGHLNLTTTYTYDARGKTLAVTEGAGSPNPRTTQYVYDKLGRRVTERLDPAGINATTTYAYDKNGNVTRKTDALGNITRFAYDADDELVYTVDALGGVSKQEYDADGRVFRSTGYANAIGLAGLPDAPTLADIAVRITGSTADEVRGVVYDDDGRETFSIDALGGVTKKTYDANGNLLRIKRFANRIPPGTALTEAAVTGALVSSASGDRVVRVVYDAANRAVYAIDAVNHVKEMQYDNAGHVSRTTLYTQPVSVGITPTAAEVAAALPAVDAAKQVDAFVYDAAGRLVSTTDAEGFTESYAYDAAGNRTGRTDKRGNVWTYAYDAAGRQTSEFSPQVAITSIDGGTLTATTVSAAIETRTAYDALGQAISRTEAYGRPEARTVQYQYDALGRKKKTIFPPVGVYSGDDLATNGITGTVNRTETTVAPESNVTYDALGNAVATRDAAGNYSYGVYDALGRVSYEIDAERYLTAYAYDVFGNKTSLTRYATALNLGAVTGYAAHADGAAFTAAEVAARLTAASTDRTVSSTYDRLNHVVQIVEPAVFTYDPTAAAGQQYFTAGRTTASTYDAFGRVVRKSVLRNQLTNTWTDTYFYYDAVDNKTAEVDALGYLTTWQYDEAGNVVRQVEYAQALAAGTWSASGFGAPAATTPQANPGSAIGYDREISYQYDRKNQKIAETRVNAEFGTVTGTLTLGNTTGDLTTSYTYDGVGNVTSVTDPTGAATYTYYDALGRLVATAEPTRFNSGANGAVAMAPVYVAYDSGSNAASLSFAKSNPADTTVTFQYKAAGASSWTTGSLVLQGNTYSFNLSGLPSDHYQYQILYTRSGESTSYATGSGDFKLVGPSSAASTNVVATVEQPALSFGLAAGAHVDQIPGEEGGYSYSFDGYNQINLSWSSLNALGNGNVRVRVNYQTYRFDYNGGAFSASGAGVATYRDMAYSASASVTGVAFAWGDPTPGWPNFTVYGGVQSISSVQVYKVVDGQEILIINSASGYTQPNRLLIRGKTAGLTGVNVAGVGTLDAVSLGAGVYAVSLATLSRGTYTFTAVGTTSTIGGTFEITQSGAAGNAGVQEVNPASATRTINAYRLPTAAASAVLQYRPAGDTGTYLSKTLNPAGSGELSIGYDDIANGTYEYILTVRDSAGALVNLTAVGGTAAGTLAGALKIRRAGELPAVSVTANGQTLTPLTVNRYDAFGGMVQSTSYARGAVSADATSYGIPVADAGDEVERTFYDSHGNVVRAVDAEGASSYRSYDVRGQVAKTWQPVTDNDGLVNNAVQVFQYDKLGRQTATVEPSYRPNEVLLNDTTALVATPLAASWSASSSQFQSWDDEYGHYYQCYGYNVINLYWNDLSSWGGGNIYARVYYYTAGTHTPTYRDVEVGYNATSTSWVWWDPGYVNQDGGIYYVYAAQLWKRDVNGGMQQIQYQSWQGSYGNQVTIPKPAQPGTAVTFKYTPQGQSNWSTASLVDMGSRYIANLNLPNGTYNYEVLYTRPGESQPYSHYQGTFTDSGGLVVGLANGNSSATTYTPPALNPANYATQQAQYNAFNEVTAKGLNNGWQEYFQYDNAGRLWRTNQSGGVNEVFLYDLQGKATADITSQTLDLKNAYSTPGQVAALSSSVQRTDTQYDYLERAVRQVAPTFYVDASLDVIPAPIGYPQMNVGFGASSVATANWGEGGFEGWSGTNNIYVNWNDLSNLGGGDVVVLVDYTNSYFGPWAAGYATSRSVTVGSAAGATGVNIAWDDEAWGAYGGIASVDRVRVWKRDSAGNAILMYDRTWSGASGNAITWATPTLVGTQITLKYKATSAANWSFATPVNFGGKEYFDTRGLAGGSYNYEILYTRPDEAAPYAHKTGVFTIGGGITDTTQSGTSLQPIVSATTATFDRWGNTLSTTDQRGYTTDYRYNHLDAVVERDQPLVDVWGANGVNAPARPVTRSYYDRMGRALGTIDANGNVSTLRYDAAGQQISEYHADGGVVSFQYDALGRQTRVIDAVGNVTSNTYDRDDRLVSVQHPIGSDSYAYDQAGNRIRETDALGLVTKYWYDTRGKVIRTQLPGGEVTNEYYDLRGNRIKEVTGNNDQPVWSYDYFGNLLTHTDMGGGVFTYTYNKVGEVTQQTLTRAGGSSTATFTYYENGALKTETDSALANETYYVYDAAGNRVRERYTKSSVVYQDNRITFDALNRIKQVQDNRYTINYKYDANGNRRNANTSYFDQSNVSHSIDSWYLYDSLNRIVLSQGVLSGGTIQTNSSQGILLQYDAAGNRRVATNYQSGSQVSESYNYDVNGRLTDTARGGQTTSSRTYDNSGRVTQEITYSSPGAIATRRTNSYNANGKLSQQLSYNSAGTLTQSTTYTGYDRLGNVTSYQISIHTGTPYTNYYSYAYGKYDSYKEAVVYGSSSYFSPGNTSTTRDIYGNALSATDQFGGPSRAWSYVNDGVGRILQKNENGQVQYYFYANDNGVGSSGALSPADFDYNYTPVSQNYPALAPSTYVVNQGNTLRQISQMVYGDAQLWYILADANGLRSDADLRVGQQLKVPNKISNLHNDSRTGKPYDPGAIIGDTTPSLPNPPPPPPPPQPQGGRRSAKGLRTVLRALGVIPPNSSEELKKPPTENIRRGIDYLAAGYNIDKEMSHQRAQIRFGYAPTLKHAFGAIHTKQGMQVVEDGVLSAPDLYAGGRWIAGMLTPPKHAPWMQWAFDSYFTWVQTGSTDKAIKKFVVEGAKWGAEKYGGPYVGRVMAQYVEKAAGEREHIDYRKAVREQIRADIITGIVMLITWGFGGDSGTEAADAAEGAEEAQEGAEAAQQAQEAAEAAQSAQEAAEAAQAAQGAAEGAQGASEAARSAAESVRSLGEQMALDFAKNFAKDFLFSVAQQAYKGGKIDYFQIALNSLSSAGESMLPGPQQIVGWATSAAGSFEAELDEIEGVSSDEILIGGGGSDFVGDLPTDDGVRNYVGDLPLDDRYVGDLPLDDGIRDNYVGDLPLGPTSARLFGVKQLLGIIDSKIKGAGSAALQKAMTILQGTRDPDTGWLRDGSPDEIEGALRTVAEERGVELDKIKADYQTYLARRADAEDAAIYRMQNPGTFKEADTKNEFRVPLLNAQNAGHMASIDQLRFGTLVGDALGIDPVFGALLSPTGGLPGSGNQVIPSATYLFFSKEAIRYHGIAHDAAGYLANYQGVGATAYRYVAGPEVIFWKPSTDPYAGQTAGALFFDNELRQRRGLGPYYRFE